MTPDREVYENGEVQLIQDSFKDPMRVTYWVKNGLASVQFTETELEDLSELLKAWDMATPKASGTMIFPFVLGLLMGILFASLIMIIFGG